MNSNPYGNEVNIQDGILTAPGLLVDLREVVAIDSYGFIFSGQTVTCEDELALHLASQWILGSASLDSPDYGRDDHEEAEPDVREFI